jgi:hypothetical protein
MSRLYRRQRQQYLLAAVVGVVGVVNVLFFLILYQPARSEYFSLKDSVQPLKAQAIMNQVNVARLERLSTQLETTGQDRRLLFTGHFIKKDLGFAVVVPDLDEMEERAGVRKGIHTDYSTPDPVAQYGLFSVKIKLPIQGSYPSVVNLLKELETSDKFYIINSIELHGGDTRAPGQPSGNGLVSLDMALETFFYQ